MPFSRPTEYPNWTTGNPGVQVEPTNSQKFGGFVPNMRPPSTWFNWLLGNISDWILWLDQQVQINNDIVTYDAVVGTNGTFADINALMASPNIANIKNVLVSTPQTVTVMQVINHDDMEFTFKPQALYAPGLGLPTCISVTSKRVRISGGRFISFTSEAIKLESTSKNCLVQSVYFNGNTLAINDLGTNNTLANNVEEV